MTDPTNLPSPSAPVAAVPALICHQPPLLLADIEPLTAHLGAAPEDFEVEEIPAYLPCGTGEHLFVLLEKRLWTTPDAVHALAKAARVPERDLGFAGMKDKNAVTLQWISLPTQATSPDTWQLPEGIQIRQSSRHGNKLRTGQLTGNRFRLRLVSASPTDWERGQTFCQQIRELGLPNYFGPQRFGRDLRNLEFALRWIRQGAPQNHKNGRFYKKLYPSVVQSEIFNRYLTARRALGLTQLLEGEVVRLNHSRAVFLVEDVAKEQPRLESGDIHLTGPIWGPKMRSAQGQPLALEQAILEEMGLTAEDLATLGHLADGTRRDLLVAPENLELLDEGEGTLRLAFSLPSGSYATQLLRELTHAPFTAEGTRGES